MPVSSQRPQFERKDWLQVLSLSAVEGLWELGSPSLRKTRPQDLQEVVIQEPFPGRTKWRKQGPKGRVGADWSGGEEQGEAAAQKVSGILAPGSLRKSRP